MAVTTPKQSTMREGFPALSSFAEDGSASRLSKARMIRAVLAADGVHGGRSPAMLDIGAGSGLVGLELSSRLGAECVQVDVVDQRVDHSLPFIRVTDESLPFADGQFDIAVANHVIEHVADQRRFVSEIRRVLKPGGVCYLATPNRYAVIEPHYKIPFLSWLPQSWSDWLVRTSRRGRGFDVAPLTRSQLHEMLAEAGFETREFTADIVAHPVRFGRRGIFARLAAPIGLVLGSGAAQISPSFAVTARPALRGSVVPSPGSRGLGDWLWDRLHGVRTAAARVTELGAPLRSLCVQSASQALTSSWAMYTAAFVLAIAPALALAASNNGAFTAPDETATHLAAKNFAETGRFYIQDELTLLNPDSTTGPRGFVQLDDRAVPIYSLGFLLVLGILHLVLGGAASYALALVPGGIALGLTYLVRQATGRIFAFQCLAFLAVVPLWYWSSRVYMDIGLTYLFVVGGLAAHVLAYQRRSFRWFFLGSVGFALAASVRNAEATLLLLLGLASIAVFVRNQHRDQGPSLLATLLLYAVAQVAFFVVPTALLNWATNGSPTLFGYQVLYSYYWPSTTVEGTGNALIAPLVFLFNTFFPQPFDASVVWGGLQYQVLLAMPVVTLLGAAGGWLAFPRLRQLLGPFALTTAVVALVYVIISRANPGTFLALSTEPDLRASLVRYWMPVYLALGIGAFLALRRSPRAVALAITLALAVSASYQVWVSSPESVRQLQAITATNSEHYSSVLEANTEPDAVVFTGARVDKWVVPVRRTAGLWSGEDIEIPHDEIMRRVADAGRTAFRAGIPVYYILGPGENITVLHERLAEHHFAITRQAEFSPDVVLWKLQVVPRDLELTRAADATYVVEPLDIGEGVSLRVVQDGASRNLITNPSFEVGTDGWSGPASGDSIALAASEAAFGQHSLRMELVGTETDFLRRSLTTPHTHPASGGWTLRARVYAPELNDAAAELRVFVQSAEGQNLERYTVELAEANEGFASIAVVGKMLPADTARLTVQIALLPTAQGGTGVVYWDGVELIDSPTPPLEYCDGRTNGCVWEGSPDASASQRSGGITGFRITLGDETIEIPGTLATGDALLFTNGRLVLTKASSGDAIVIAPTLPTTDVAHISFESISTPRLATRTDLPVTDRLPPSTVEP